jgi:hypothetical protein
MAGGREGTEPELPPATVRFRTSASVFELERIGVGSESSDASRIPTQSPP